MPLYQYVCHECATNWEAINRIAERLNQRCPDCDGEATIVITLRARPVIHEYYSDNLGAQITGPRQKKRIMKEKGVEESG